MSSYSNWVRRCLLRLQYRHTRRTFCNDTKNNNVLPQHQHQHHNQHSKMDNYRALENLDFTKAAKILFSSPPPTKNKFGLDFHLVQLFFALMPSLAVYLVAQYARYDMRKMEKELEMKKKAEEEQKAKELEGAQAEEKEVEAANPELLKVKERLEVLEHTVKEFVVETKKKQQSESSKSINADQNKERVDPTVSISAETAVKEQPAIQKATGSSQKQVDSEKVEKDEKK